MKVRCSNWALQIYKRYDDENPLHFIHEIKTNGHDAIGGNVFHRMLIRFHRKKDNSVMRPILLESGLRSGIWTKV